MRGSRCCSRRIVVAAPSTSSTTTTAAVPAWTFVLLLGIADPAELAAETVSVLASEGAHAMAERHAARRLTEQAAQARLLRDIVGNPFRPVAFNPGWRRATVTALAAAVYEERHLPSGLFDNGRLGILADALEDAGCDNGDILGHLRGGGEHVRGCWAVDLILGKE